MCFRGVTYVVSRTLFYQISIGEMARVGRIKGFYGGRKIGSQSDYISGFLPIFQHRLYICCMTAKTINGDLRNAWTLHTADWLLR